MYIHVHRLHVHRIVTCPYMHIHTLHTAEHVMYYTHTRSRHLLPMVEQERMGTVWEREDIMWNFSPGNACMASGRSGSGSEREREKEEY